MRNKILFIFSLIFGLLFINAGLNKLFQYIPVPEDLPAELAHDFKAMVEISWLMPVLALAEIIGGLLIIIPKTRALGALIIFPVMVGIVLTNTIVDTSGLPMVIGLVIIFCWIISDNWKKYLAILK